MKTEIDIKIRKLRKKLRQIENLERLNINLSAEEQLKVFRKAPVRAELRELLSSVSAGGGFLTTALATDDAPALDSTAEYTEATDSSSGEEEEYGEDEEDDDEEDGEEDEEEEPKQAGDREQGELTEECIRSGSEGIYGVTDEEKMMRQQMTVEREHVDSTVTDASPARKYKQDINPATSRNETRSSRATDSKSSSQSSVPKCSAYRQLQKKWCRSHWGVELLSGHNDLVCSVSLWDRWLLTGSRDTTVKLWNTVCGTEVRSMGGHTGTVTAVVMVTPQQTRPAVSALSLERPACMSDPGLGISASSDCSINLWDLSSGEMLKSMYAFSPVTKLAFTVWKDIPCLISGSDGGKVELWDLEAGSPCQSLRDHACSITGLSIEDDCVYSSSADGEIRVYQIRNTSLHTIFVSENVKLTSGSPLHWRLIRSLSVANDLIYFGDDAMNLKVVDWKEGVAHKLSNHMTEFGATDAVVVSKDLDLLLSSGYDLDNGLGFINVRQLSTEKYLCSLCDEMASRIVDVDCCRTTSDESSITMVTAGMELLLWKQLDSEQNANAENLRTVRAQFVSHFTQAARHSDVESESEAEITLDGDAEDEDAEDDDDDGTVSPPFHGRRAAADDDGAGRGWLSWCSIV